MSRVSACVLVLSNGFVLAIGGPKNPDGWGLPGGKAEPGEHPAMAAARECLEETGIRAVAITRLYRAECEGFDCHTFLATAWEGALVSSREGMPEWVLPEKLLLGRYGEYNAGVLAALAGMKR